MKVLSEDTKFAHLGKPGTAFTKGFERRLDLLKTFVDFKDKKILDLGTGEGVWLSEFIKLSSPEKIYGSEYDPEQIEFVRSTNPTIPSENIVNCPGEKLTFPNEFFDIVFQNEVLEHVQDDQQVLNECFRVLNSGGHLIFFTPNRGWPFEQHGMFIGKKYYWGNIPLLSWMPESIYKKLAPHVKNYWAWELDKMLKNSGFEIELHTYIFPGFDGAVRKLGLLGKLIQKTFFLLEKTPFKVFGISHVIVAKKQ
ncbi:MAG: class I SAM-dependent methyltransferase [Candidatus Dojkabacteria bacterium]